MICLMTGQAASATAWLKMPKRSGHRQQEGWVDLAGIVQVDPTTFAYLLIFAHKDSEKSFLPPSVLTLLTLPMMAHPGTPQQDLFPIRRPGNGPPGLRARHWPTIGLVSCETFAKCFWPWLMGGWKPSWFLMYRLTDCGK